MKSTTSERTRSDEISVARLPDVATRWVGLPWPHTHRVRGALIFQMQVSGWLLPLGERSTSSAGVAVATRSEADREGVRTAHGATATAATTATTATTATAAAA